MHRWFALILMALLPIQLSWAAVAAYCAHESDARVEHPGHHDHQHRADVGMQADKSSAGDKAPGELDLDCGQCHGFGQAVLFAVSILTGPADPAQPAAAVDEGDRGTAPHPPERPQWASLA